MSARHLLQEQLSLPLVTDSHLNDILKASGTVHSVMLSPSGVAGVVMVDDEGDGLDGR